MTIVVLSYNQADFLVDAVQGAFAQTYSPLEVLLSDDGSRDGSYELLCRLAAEYRGPHEIRLFRNEQPSGLAGHLNRVAGLMRGELLVVAAGDDVSMSERVQSIYEAWVASDRQGKAFHSSYLRMNSEGQKLGVYQPSETEGVTAPDIARAGAYILGAVACWHREVFTRFPPLDPQLVNEDGALLLRAALIGRIVAVPRLLVHWRTHANSLSNSLHLRHLGSVEEFCGWEAERAARKLSVAQQGIADILESGLGTKECYPGLMRRAAAARLRLALFKADLPLKIRRSFFVSAMRHGSWTDAIRQILKLCLIYPYFLLVKSRNRRKARAWNSKA